ncbi:hypothetical protein [Streptacidiphilus anmyonensis]|uniref:hypothetical protein n=1 Tax=Streptacidiphilus anmyonensis TaxID=405782 RepID=UPI000694058F|nr:hypothetical protein [Streptacidiphilus anmyonensis]
MARSISRAQVIARARAWIGEGVPYSQTAWWTDANGTYRQDCSGFVSMAWALEQRDDFWTGNLALVAHPIPADALLPGDILLSATHTVIFAGWDDPSHTTFDLYEEAHTGTAARYVSGADFGHYADSGFTAYRDNLIADADPQPAAVQYAATPVGVADQLASLTSTPLPVAPPLAFTDAGGHLTSVPAVPRPPAAAPAGDPAGALSPPLRPRVQYAALPLAALLRWWLDAATLTYGYALGCLRARTWARCRPTGPSDTPVTPVMPVSPATPVPGRRLVPLSGWTG